MSVSIDGAAAAELRFTGGAVDRTNTVATFHAPVDWPKRGLLKTSAADEVAYQVDTQGIGRTVLPRLGARQTVTVSLIQGADPAQRLSVQPQPGRLGFQLDGKPVFSLQTVAASPPRPDVPAKFQRGGYLHPILTPLGQAITDDYPTNHLHHHGIWSAWTKTEFQGRHPDFWNMGDQKGKVDIRELSALWQGPVDAGFETQLTYTDLTGTSPTAVLEEQWTVRVYAIRTGTDRARRVFDLESHQKLLTDAPLLLPKYHYGGVGFRGLEQWNGKGNWKVLTASGETDREKANFTKSPWCYVGGAVAGGGQGGIAILCHPTNFRAPQPMRVHPTEPFFNYAPQQDGDMSLQPAQTYVARYRYVVFDGEPDRAEIQRWWEDYADPVEGRF